MVVLKVHNSDFKSLSVSIPGEFLPVALIAANGFVFPFSVLDGSVNEKCFSQCNNYRFIQSLVSIPWNNNTPGLPIPFGEVDIEEVTYTLESGVPFVFSDTHGINSMARRIRVYLDTGTEVLYGKPGVIAPGSIFPGDPVDFTPDELDACQFNGDDGDQLRFIVQDYQYRDIPPLQHQIQLLELLEVLKMSSTQFIPADTIQLGCRNMSILVAHKL